jgi:hypothetical protein
VDSAFENVLAKQEIGEALARYARGIDRHDAALAKSAYHSDAYDEHGPSCGNAHEVMDRIHVALASLEASQHRITNVLIEVEGAAAFVESYFHALHIEKGTGMEEHVFGRYADRFERREDGWKIARRKVVVDFTSCRPKGEPLPLESSFIRGRRDRDDVSYDRS